MFSERVHQHDCRASCCLVSGQGKGQLPKYPIYIWLILYGKFRGREVATQRETKYTMRSRLPEHGIVINCHEVHIQKGHEIQLRLVGNHFKHSFFSR